MKRFPLSIALALVAVSLLVVVVLAQGGPAAIVQAAAAAPAAKAPATTPAVQQDTAGRRYIVESAPELRIDQVQSKKNSLDGLDLDGVVTNTGTKALEYPSLAITMYDAQGRVVDTDTAFTTITTLAPGQSSPFSLMSMTPAGTVASYRVQVVR